jgi:hypothetical protein
MTDERTQPQASEPAAPTGAPPARIGGRWAKGMSGNAGGRPKVVAEVRELAQQHGPEAVKTLALIMADESQPGQTRIAASTALLDRGYGKPVIGVRVDAPHVPIVIFGQPPGCTPEMAALVCDQSPRALPEAGTEPPL